MNNSAGNTVRLFAAGLRALLALTVLLGVLYPLAVTGLAQLAFPGRANGSEIRDASGRVVGSELIGQRYEDLRWFQPRPSRGLGTNSVNTRYALLVSGATNRSGDSADLVRWVAEARAAVVRDNSTPGHPVRPAEVPADAVTSSGSGLDPHISPAYARLQVRRVAERNHLAVARVERLVAEHTEGRTLGFVGEPRVNVLRLNIALKALVAGGS
ncbi:potassium-transporting ATPase subunit KdpC [Streptomyces sp. NPDC004787]|uniref:potassium-transporting ATPase subunit KdpC n=1 Tax=Streptomyces sp. NPDC004787 TaxID=3154291 RepID=UPI0033B1C050